MPASQACEEAMRAFYVVERNSQVYPKGQAERFYEVGLYFIILNVFFTEFFCNFARVLDMTSFLTRLRKF